mmetsp:Transcript_8432/g.24169  ORF Transcript_8432/g.24169 Transcript_8432/m.24169 type:complete len:203 (-) Transcript_8432:763-1371(-)
MIVSWFPVSSSLSASSKTKKRTVSNGSFPVSTRSMIFPGVPVTMSTPSARALMTGFGSTPPTTSSARRPGEGRCFLNCCMKLCVCSARSLVGSRISASGLLPFIAAARVLPPKWKLPTVCVGAARVRGVNPSGTVRLKGSSPKFTLSSPFLMQIAGYIACPCTHRGNSNATPRDSPFLKKLITLESQSRQQPMTSPFPYTPP